MAQAKTEAIRAAGKTDNRACMNTDYEYRLHPWWIGFQVRAAVIGIRSSERASCKNHHLLKLDETKNDKK